MSTLKIRSTGSVNVTAPKPIKISTYSSETKNDGSALGYLGARAGIGAAGIFEGIGDFVQGSVYQLMGDKEYAKYLHMNDVTGGWRERLDKSYNPSGVMRVVGDISEGVGQAIPSFAVGAVTGGLGAAAGAIGSAAIGAGYAGRGITDAVKQTGELGFKENVYGITAGSLEAITDKFIGGAQKAGKALAGGIGGTLFATKLGAQKVARKTLIKGMLSSAGSEALEEFIQEYADTALLRLTKVNREAEFSFSDALYSAFIGGITGGIMGGAVGAVNDGVNFRRGADVRQRGLEEQLIKTADYVRDVHLGNVSNWDNVTNDSLKALAASVDAYRKLSDKSSRKGTVILGEIKRELLAFETSAGVDGIKAKMMSATESARQELARSASALFGKEVTAADIASDKDGITRRLALESFIAEAVGDSATDTRRAQISEAIAAERLPYIKQSASWDGESAAQYRDPKTGQYVFVEPAEGGAWRIGYTKTAIYDENAIMVREGLDTETVKKTLAGLANGSLVVGERGIYTPEALEREKVKQFKNTKKGRKAKKDYKRELKEEKKSSIKNVTPTSDVRSKVAGRRYYSIASGDRYVEYDKPINQDDVKTLQAIGEGISINQFSSGNIRETQKWAYKFYKELGIKSPFFRRWFGDWRRFDKKTVKVITANKVEGKNPRGVFTNSDTGWNIVSSSVGYDETVSHSGKDKKSIKAMRVIDKIIENSILLDTQVSNYGRGKKSIYTSFMHKFYAIVKIDDMPYLAKMAVDESYDPGHTETYKKFYHVRAIEIEPMASVGIGFNHTPIMETTSSTISIADLYEIVKTYDKEFSTASQVNKVALNDDGTPKVFYHGTKVEIAEFNRGEKNGWLGKGIYFAEDKKYAKENGKRIVVAYLRINNPFIVKGESPSDILSEVKEKFPQADEYSLADVLKAEGYDSIVFKHWDKGMIISVFEPSQIKSANGNIGTFDSDEKKIKYSIDTTEGSQSDERVEGEQESVSEAQEAAESENASEKPKEMSEREQKRGYSDKEANAARALVKDFDTMSREKRLSIIEMMRSAESCGASKSFMKHAAAMIGYWRKGLWIIADDKTSENGFYQPFDDGTRLIVVNPSKKSDKGKSAIDTAFVHELAHDIWDRATAKTRDALYRLATEGASAAEVEDIRKEYKDGYEARGLKLDEETLREEVFTNLIAKALGNEAFLERFDITPGRMTAFKRSIKAVTRMAKCFFGKDKYLYNRCEKMARAIIRVMGEQTALEAVGTNVRFSIGETDDNRPVVVVNDDIVRYAANDKELVKLVKKSISKTKYVAINKQKIFFIDDTKNEVTYSEYTKKLRRKSPDVYQDKMRLFNHPSEVILATTNYINEGLSHPRKDDIIDFARGELLIDIQGRKYSAEVVIGFTNKGICELHDIVKIKPASFKYKTRHALRTISSSNEHFQTGANLVNNSIPQNPEKSTENAKKSFSLSENSSAKGGEFDGKDFIEQAIENGGSFEKAKDAASAHAKANNPKKKSKTKAQIQAELRETKKENRGLKKANENISKTAVRAQERSSELFEKNRELERKAKAAEANARNTEKKSAAAGERLERENAAELKRVAAAVKKIVEDVSFLMNEASHRKYTDGGLLGAKILSDPGIRAFAKFFSKREHAYNIMGPTTRVGVKLLLEFYNPNNPIFADENSAAMFFGENSNNIFSSYRPEVAEMIKSIAEGKGNLSIYELKMLGDITKNISFIYHNYDAVIREGKLSSAKVEAARDYEAQRAASRILDDGREDKGLKKFFRIFKESYLYTVVTPEEVLRDLENHVKNPILSQLYREVRLGEAEAGKIQAEILSPITDFLAKKENRAFFDNINKPTVDFKGVKISVAQAVGIYETSKREHATERLFNPEGGVRLNSAEKGKPIHIKNITRDDVRALYAGFDATAKEYVRYLEEAMAACKKYKVDTDIKVMGFTNAIDGHYYPISIDDNYFARDITDIRQSMGLDEVVKNKSFNKNTTAGAKAPLFIEDSQRVLERHVFGIGQYAGLYIPLQNFGKVYGAKFDPTVSAEAQNRGEDIDELRASMIKKTSLREYYNSVWAKNGGKGGLDSYLTKLFADIQRIKPGETSVIDRAVEFIRRGYVNSVFGLNAKIIFTQLASYPAAFRLIDVDCLVKAFGNDPFSSDNVKAMDENSRITLARQFEGSNAADGLIEKLSRVGKLTSAGIEFTDRNTIKLLYSACQLQIEKDGGAAVGSKENLKAAAKLLDNVLLDTQTTSLMSDRSALARDKNEFAKMLSMFRNEAVKAFSNFYGSIGAYVDHKRLSESDTEYGELLEEDKKKIARNAIAYLGSSAVVAAVSIAFARLRSAGKPEDEKEKIGAMIAEKSIGAVFDLFPIFSDAAGFMMDGYAMDSIPLEVINDVLSALRGTKTLLDPEATREAKAKHLRDSSYTVGKVLGLPIRNAVRIAETTVGIFNKPLAYKFSDSFDTSKSYKSDLDKAMSSGNLRLAQTITSLWVSDRMTGKASKEAVDELVRLYSVVDEEGNRIFKYPKVVPSSLSAKEKARFMEVYSEADAKMGELLLSKEYKALDDKGKAKAVKDLYNGYYKLAEAEISK